MIVEHVFITTLDGADALGLAWEFLAYGGFSAVFDPTGSGRPNNSLDVRRGRESAARALSIDELPQRVRVDWDRGRVTVAASIEYFQHGAFSTGTRSEPPAHSPKIRPHIELMHAVVGGLEAVLANRMPVDEAVRHWSQLESRLRDESARKRRRRTITLWTVFALIVLFVVAIIALNTR